MPNYSSSVDIFYIDGVVWLATGNSATSGLDAETGKVVKKYEQEVTGPMGHDRCYRNLITEKYFINSKTGGTDFVDLSNGDEHPNHSIRGTCGLGVLPANGLLYSTPYSCTCSMGDMMPGLNAYSADPELLKTNDSKLIKRKIRLEKGPAYGKASGKAATKADWPVYRGNNFRGGITKSPVSPKLNLKWQVKLPGNPTASIVVGDTLYVCTPDTHMLYAMNTACGKIDWTFTAGGRIDSPPTYYKGMVIFGSKDGWLYCLRASDGALAWRFKDLPDRLIGAFGQLESAWPIFGSVLVVDNKIYVTAGRSSFFDGGVFFYCIDPVSGKLLNSRSSYGPFHKTTGRPVGFNLTGRPEDFANLKKKKDLAKLFLPEREGYFPGFRNDLLVSDGESLHMRHCSFNKHLDDIPPITDRLMPLSSFLDRRVQHRTGFIFKHNLLGWKNNPSDLMITDHKDIFAISGFRATTNHTYFDPRANSYTLSGGSLKKVPLTINGRALAKAGDVIFVAGEQMKFKHPTWQNYVAAYSGKLGGKLIAISAKDGKELASCKLKSPIVWDSTALAGGKLYISLTDGTIQCYGE
jgi:outer membrane protein assembly factor BamB